MTFTMCSRLVLGSLIWLFLASPSFAFTYYIDRTNGLDTRTSTDARSKDTPWKNAPGMPCATNNAASFLAAAGDSIILKGGETWPNACLTWTWGRSGTVGARIYLGVDQTWFTGGAWTRPILDGGGVAMGANSEAIKVNGGYVTIDNFEFTGGISGPVSFGKYQYINAGAFAATLIIEHCYFHGWSAPSGTATWANIRATAGPGLGLIVRYNVFSGLDSPPVAADPTCATGPQNCKADGFAVVNAGYFIGNVAEYVVTGYFGEPKEVAYNLIRDVRKAVDPAAHGNCFESLFEQANALIHDNIIYKCRSGVTVWVIPRLGNITYYWNNVVLDSDILGNVFNVGHSFGVNPQWTSSNCCGTVIAVNNTIQCGSNDSATLPCVSDVVPPNLQNLVFKNNHLISSHVTPIQWTSPITNVTNLIQTQAAANAQGYTYAQAPYKFATTDVGDATVGTGTNLTADCAVMTTLCSDTLYGVVYDETAHTATLYGRTPNARSGTGAWDIGAYQGVAATPIPDPPANLRLVGTSSSANVTLIWDPSVDPTFAGFHVYQSPSSGTVGVLVKTNTPASVAATHSPLTQTTIRLPQGGTHCFTIKEFATDLTESVASNEYCTTVAGMAARTARTTNTPRVPTP